MRLLKTFLLLLCGCCRLAAQNAVLDWNRAVLNALKKDASPPLLVARTLAILHDAQRSALEETASAGEREAEASAGEAAYTVAAALVPHHKAEFETLRDQASPGASIEALRRGVRAGQRALEERAGDGSSTYVAYIPRSDPGRWRRTPPFFRPPELPQWALKVKPFALERPEQFRPAGPPPMTGVDWARAFEETKTLGGKKSRTRTAEQTLIAKFWSDFSYTETPPGHWNSIAHTLLAGRNTPVRESARLFGRLNEALTDAGIACWDAKYFYDFWRPVTAIARAQEDENPATEADAAWQPLLTTPAHPEYPSGHSTFSGAALVVLADFLGGDTVEFAVRSDGLPGAERRFTSLRTCAQECGLSRVYGGIHYRFSCDDGMELGERVGWCVLKGR